MKKLVLFAAVMAVVAPGALQPAMAASSKFAAQISNFELVPTVVCSATDVQNSDCSSAKWTTVLATAIQTPNQKDLLIGGSLQTAVGTSTTVASKGAKSSAGASATINVRVVVDGKVAQPCAGSTGCANGAAYPYQVTYDARVQDLSATLGGLNCTANTTTGVITCTDPETISLLIQTTGARSFNFVAPNLFAGSHSIELQVNVGTSAQSDSLGAGASATAEVGVGTLTVQDVQATNLPDGITFTQ